MVSNVGGAAATRPLALHQITAMEVAPLDLPALAGQVGCQQVCLFVRAPMVPDESGVLRALFPYVDAQDVEAMCRVVETTGVSIMNIEYFPIEEGVDIEDYRGPVAVGQAIGAKRLVTHVHVTDEDKAVARLRELSDLAGEYGLSVGLEFMGLSPGCNSLSRARTLVERADRPNLGIAIDALHLVRTGSTVDQVASLAPSMIEYVQMCDGPHLDKSDDYLPEALDRMLPGEGVFPLVDLLRALPVDVDIDVEVPSAKGEKIGLNALERADAAVRASRALLAAARP